MTIFHLKKFLGTDKKRGPVVSQGRGFSVDPCLMLDQQDS